METSFGNPYIDFITEEEHIRKFAHSVNEYDLIWHRDKQDRAVEVISGTGWKIQFDDCLPVLLEKGKEYMIPKMQFHRILKGKSDLIIKIKTA